MEHTVDVTIPVEAQGGGVKRSEGWSAACSVRAPVRAVSPMPFAEMKAAARAAGMTDRCEKAESKTGRGQVIGKLLLKSGRGVLHDES